jgi:DNA-binding HxlR family transcriptional regulator
MIQQWNPYSAACPTRMILDRIGDKWTVLLLGLLERSPMRFNALRREIAGLSQKVLSQTLKDLQRDGLVHRAAFATVPVTVEYSLTPLGLSLASAVAQLVQWAEHNVEDVLAARATFDGRKADDETCG